MNNIYKIIGGYDYQWERTGLLDGVEEPLKTILVDNLNLTKIEYDNNDYLTLVVMVLRDLYEHPDFGKLITKYSIHDLVNCAKQIKVDTEFMYDVQLKSYMNIDFESELLSLIKDSYIEQLVQTNV